MTFSADVNVIFTAFYACTFHTHYVIAWLAFTALTVMLEAQNKFGVGIPP